MSGPICPDCGSFDIHRIDASTDRCDFCGWEGPPLPRKSLTLQSQHSLAEQNRRNRELKEAGELFFLRIHLNEPSTDYDATRSKIYEILDTSAGITYNAAQSYFFLKMKTKPSLESIKRVQSLEEVEKVELI